MTPTRYRDADFQGASRVEAVGEFVAVLSPAGISFRYSFGDAWVTIDGTFYDIALAGDFSFGVDGFTLRAFDNTGEQVFAAAHSGVRVVAIAPDLTAGWLAAPDGRLILLSAGFASTVATSFTGEEIVRLIHLSSTQVAAFTREADLIVYEYDASLPGLTEASRLHIPEGYGLRSFYRNSDGEFIIVGTDRLGRGAVVTATVAEITDVDRTLASQIIQGADGESIATQLPSDGIAWRPWFSPTHAVAATDNVSVAVCADAGEVWLYEEAPCIPPGLVALPQLTGTPEVGETLTITPGVYTGDGLSHAYSWWRWDGMAATQILGEAGLTYVLTEDDVGFYIYIVDEVTGTCGSLQTNTPVEGMGPVTGAGCAGTPFTFGNLGPVIYSGSSYTASTDFIIERIVTDIYTMNVDITISVSPADWAAISGLSAADRTLSVYIRHYSCDGTLVREVSDTSTWVITGEGDNNFTFDDPNGDCDESAWVYFEIVQSAALEAAWPDTAERGCGEITTGTTCSPSETYCGCDAPNYAGSVAFSGSDLAPDVSQLDFVSNTANEVTWYGTDFGSQEVTLKWQYDCGAGAWTWYLSVTDGVDTCEYSSSQTSGSENAPHMLPASDNSGSIWELGDSITFDTVSSGSCTDTPVVG